MRTAIVITVAVLAQAAGNTLVSKGMKAIAAMNSVSDVLSPWVIVQVMRNPLILAGTALLILFFILFTASLSWADLSYVLPASSFGYVLNVAFAHHFLNEPVSASRWGGSILIFLGVAMVSGSGKVRTAPLERSTCQPTKKS